MGLLLRLIINNPPLIEIETQQGPPVTKYPLDLLPNT